MHYTAVAVVVVVALAQAAGGAEELQYSAPRGWARATLPSGAVAFQPKQMPAGKGCSVQFLPAAQAELVAHFDDTWRRTTGGVKVVSGGKVVAGRTSGGLPSRSVTAVVDSGGQRTWMHFFAVQAGPRVEMVLYAANDEGMFEKHFAEADAMFDSFRLPGAVAKVEPHDGDQTAPPAHVTKKKTAKREKKENAFDAVYYAAKVEFSAVGAPGSRQVRTDYLCFSSDGHVFHGTPTGGPVEVFENPPDSPYFGTYAVDGDAITIQYGHDKVLNRRLTHEGRRVAGGVEVNGTKYHAIPSCDGLTLDGTYSWKWGGGESVIRFTRDGRFTARGLGDTTSDDELVHPDWPKMPARGSGTYAIERNTLEVRFDNGPTRRIFFVTRDDPADVKSVTINSYPHERVK